MKKFTLYPSLLLSAMLVIGCSSMPKTNSILEQARSDYQTAQINTEVVAFAPLELKQAGDALALANTAFNDKEKASEVDKLAYLAKQKIATAREVAKQKAAEKSVIAAGKIRDEMRLDQRTNEADRAKAAAEAAEAKAKLAQADAQAAQRSAEDARRSTMEAQERARQLEAQLRDLAAKQTERGLVMTLGDVLFGVNQANLTPAGMNTAQKLASFMKQYPQRKVMVEGFTDSTGSSAYNQDLSDRRSQSVANALLGMGVERERISSRGYGEAYPVAGNDSGANRQMNRRVEIVISDDQGMIKAR